MVINTEPTYEIKNAVIIQVTNSILKEYDLEEFKALASAANYSVIDVIKQHVIKINPKYFLGKGKADEIEEKYSNLLKKLEDFDIHKKIEKRKEDEVVFLFNNRLGSAQILNLSEKFHSKVVDRDLLILEIFELNAMTRESKLQIELARIGLETSRKQKELSQKLKSEKQGRGFMGKGYGAYDAYKRSYKEKRKKIMDELSIIRKQRALQRKSRNKEFNISIVGYTNAGKTTLMNSIRKTDFKTKNTAFTTVSTRTRRIEYFGDILIFTDTVGFVYDIPHSIIEAFLSTLEEASFSDCIIILSDISDSEDKIRQKLQTTFVVLSKIQALNIPVVYVFNKMDKLTEEELSAKKKFIKDLLPPHSIVQFISAKDKKLVFELVKLMQLIKKRTILVSSGEEFAKTLINAHNSEIEKILDSSYVGSEDESKVVEKK